MNTSDILNKAADLIEQRGWTRGINGWGSTSVNGLCLEGGIMAALGYGGWEDVRVPEDLWSCPAYIAVSNHIGFDAAARDNSGDNTEPLWRFNDARGRTASEVIEVLRATALVESARETQSAEVSA